MRDLLRVDLGIAERAVAAALQPNATPGEVVLGIVRAQSALGRAYEQAEMELAFEQRTAAANGGTR